MANCLFLLKNAEKQSPWTFMCLTLLWTKKIFYLYCSKDVQFMLSNMENQRCWKWDGSEAKMAKMYFIGCVILSLSLFTLPPAYTPGIWKVPEYWDSTHTHYLWILFFFSFLFFFFFFIYTPKHFLITRRSLCISLSFSCSLSTQDVVALPCFTWPKMLPDRANSNVEPWCPWEHQLASKYVLTQTYIILHMNRKEEKGGTLKLMTKGLIQKSIRNSLRGQSIILLNAAWQFSIHCQADYICAVVWENPSTHC